MRVRAILMRILHTVERTERIVTAAADQMRTALDGLDTQMASLQQRLVDEADALLAALANANVAAEDEAALTAAADRIRATAETVAGLAKPSAVVDDTQPNATAGPLPDGDVPAPDTQPTQVVSGGTVDEAGTVDQAGTLGDLQQ